MASTHNGGIVRKLVALLAQSAAGSGAACVTPFDRLANASITVHVPTIAGGDSLQVEGTIDGTNWFALGAAITAVGIAVITTPVASIRVTKTGTAGNAVANAWM